MIPSKYSLDYEDEDLNDEYTQLRCEAKSNRYPKDSICHCDYRATTQDAASGSTTDAPSTTGRHHRIYMQNSVQTPSRAKLGRHLRKFASEASFVITPEANSNSSIEHETRRTKGRQSAERAAKQNTPRIINVGALRCMFHLRNESDDGSASVISEATIASSSVTPTAKRRLKFMMQRPKSVTQMGYPLPPTVSQLNTSRTSATLRSLDSLQLPEIRAVADERRISNTYMIDEDSTNEFEDENGKSSLLRFLFFTHKMLL
ncbi:hypothetical protein AB6A40_002186 [Gnathostoma spinigerum]|uniref:Uncharacterized protein n=1 Tax=Gnathostoma spinigerum TaxID=75299 RepID=A0ABD6E861_9BILA